MAYAFNDDKSKADIVTVECEFEANSESKVKNLKFSEIGLDKYVNYNLDKIIILSCQTKDNSTAIVEAWDLIGDSNVRIDRISNSDGNRIRFTVSTLPTIRSKTVKATLLFLN